MQIFRFELDWTTSIVKANWLTTVKTILFAPLQTGNYRFQKAVPPLYWMKRQNNPFHKIWTSMYSLELLSSQRKKALQCSQKSILFAMSTGSFKHAWSHKFWLPQMPG